MGHPVAITSGPANELFPVTNGTVVVYASNATGDFDLYYAPVTGAGTATRLELTDVAGSNETHLTISENLVAMRRTLPGETNADLYVFDLATNQLFQLPPTPDVNERWSDIAVDVDGTVHVVWTAVDPLQPDDDDNVYGFSFVPNRASYGVCALFDTSKSFKAGRVVPVRIQLCDANGANLSSPELVLTATTLAHHDSTASPDVAPDSAGEANADGVFRYDETLEGYVFNLATSGLASGTWELQVHVSGDAYTYGIRFDIK